MKKIVYLLSILVILSLIGNLMLLKKYRSLKSYSLDITDEYEQLTVKQGKITSVLKENSVLQHSTEAMLCPDILLVEPIMKHNTRLSQIVKKKAPLLFFRFKETDCDACVQHVLNMLKNIAKQFPQQQIIVLSGYKNVRQFYAYAGNENKLFKVYNVKDLPILPDNYTKPYFFVLNGNMELRDVFFYVKEDPEMTINYLKCISHKYWQCDEEHCSH